MDAIIKRRMIHDVIVSPYKDIIDGDKEYGDQYTIKGYVVDVTGTTVDRSGNTVTSTTTVYLDGKYAESISDDDEIQTPFKAMRPILNVARYPGLKVPYELVVIKL